MAFIGASGKPLQEKISDFNFFAENGLTNKKIFAIMKIDDRKEML